MNPLIGQVLKGRYRVEASLGRGGMAEVYKVWDEERSTYLALKLLRRDLAQDQIFLRRFKREAQTLAKLQHPQIVRFYGLEQDERLAFMLMDYIEGDSLQGEIFDLQGTPMPMDRILEILQPVCGGLQYAHRQGFIHCDLKPGNILIHTNGSVLLTDFGIARLTDAATMTMVGMGTPAYMAPELIRGQQPLPQTDIYSLGVILFEMLTGGERPFTGERAEITGSTSEKVRWEQMNLEPASPKRWNPEITPELDALVLQSLDKGFSERPESVLELLGGLDELYAALKAPSLVSVVTPVFPSLEGEVDKHSVVDPEPPPEPEPLFKRGCIKGALSPKMPMGWKVWIGIGVAATILMVVGNGVLSRIAPHPPIVETVVVAVPMEGTAVQATQVIIQDPTETARPELGQLIKGPYVVPVPSRSMARLGEAVRNAVGISPDGEILAVGSSLGITYYRMEGLYPIRLDEVESPVLSVAFSPDGVTLASGSMDGTLILWDARTGKLLDTLNGHTGSVKSVAFSPDGGTLTSGSGDETVILWDVQTGERLCILEGHTGTVWSVAFSPAGKTLASGSHDGTVILWEVGTGERLDILEGHLGSVRSVAFSPDGGTLASGSSDGTVILWDVNTGDKLDLLERYMESVLSLDFSLKGRMLASLSGDGTVVLRDLRTGERLDILEGHLASVRSVAFSPDGVLLVSGSTDGEVRLWLVADGESILALEGHTRGISSVAFSPDGATMASGSADSTVQLWRVSDGVALLTLDVHPGGQKAQAFYVLSVAFSPDGDLLASGSADGTVRVWRVHDGAALRILDGGGGGIMSVVFSPDGSLLASGSTNGEVRVWRRADGAHLYTLDARTSVVSSVAFSPDGTTLASGQLRYPSVKLWRIADGTLLRTIEGQMDSVYSVAFSPDGNLLASGSSDGIVRLWKVSDGRLVETLEGHTARVNSVAFSPCGEILASGSDDGTIVLWEVE